MVTPSLKCGMSAPHHCSLHKLLRRFDIHRPGVKWQVATWSRDVTGLSLLLLGGAYYHQHLRSAQYFSIPRRPLSAFLWLLHSSDIDVGLHSTAPPLTADLSLAIFCLRGLRHSLGLFFFPFFWRGGGWCWGSQAAPVKNETFTIPLGCKFEFLVLKLGGRVPFMR